MSVRPTLAPPAAPAGSYVEEWIENAGLTQSAAATKVGISRKTLNQIVRGHAPITPETALKLERASGIPTEYWLRVEANYKAALERRRAVDELAGCRELLAGGGEGAGHRPWHHRRPTSL